MISVNQLYEITNSTLTKDFQSGYTNNTEFNMLVNLAQEVLIDYYQQQYSGNLKADDIISPFVTEKYYTTADEFKNPLPDDYRYHVSAAYYAWINDCDKTRRELRGVINNTSPEQIEGILLNGVKKRAAWYVINSNNVVFYNTGNLEKKLKYIKNPTTAERKVTINIGSRQEIYDDSTTVDLEWNANVLNDFVTLLLFYKGVELEHNRLIQFAQNKQLYPN